MTPDELQRLAALKGREFLPAAREHADAMRKREAGAILRGNDGKPFGLESCVGRYCRAFKASGMPPFEFARWASANFNLLPVLNIIGSWPSSEPELAALQRVL